MRTWLHIFCQHSLTHCKQHLNMVVRIKKRSQILGCAIILPPNLDFCFSGNAAKELRVLYTEIAGSYFNLCILIYCKPQQQLMRANPRGTVEVILNLVFSDSTKGRSFSYIPALPSCFSCMNKGHLKWFGFETKEGL